MSGQDLNEALDALDGPGRIEVDEAGGRTEVDVVESGKLGVRVREVAVGHPHEDVGERSKALPGRLHAIAGRVVPIEVDPTLGGAILRTDPDQLRRGRFFQLDVRPERTRVRRFSVEGGQRESDEFTLTREQLRDLVDEVRGPVDDGPG